MEKKTYWIFRMCINSMAFENIQNILAAHNAYKCYIVMKMKKKKKYSTYF